jgi:hypothetical protein
VHGIGLCVEILSREYDDEAAGDVEQRMAEILKLGHSTAQECSLVVVVETADMLVAVAPLAPSPAAPGDQDSQGDQARQRAVLPGGAQARAAPPRQPCSGSDRARGVHERVHGRIHHCPCGRSRDPHRQRAREYRGHRV